MPTKSRLLVPYDPKVGPATSRNRSGYAVQLHVEMHLHYLGREGRDGDCASTGNRGLQGLRTRVFLPSELAARYHGPGHAVPAWLG